MAQHYRDAKRETETHELPDVETFEVTTGEWWYDDNGERTDEPVHDCAPCENPDECTEHAEWTPVKAGWYHWTCLPGCLPDSEPFGPFKTEAEALADSREQSGLCEHGIEDGDVCEDCPAPELWVLRDESLHLKFGIQLIHTVLEENAELLTAEFAEEIRNIVIEGVGLEVNYNKDMFPKGILGLNADYVNQYVQYVADRRLEELGLEPHFNVTNPAKWMSTATDVFELVNFFEAQNTSYEVDAHGHKNEKKEDKKPPSPSEE